jgi:hypothetical protein
VYEMDPQGNKNGPSRVLFFLFFFVLHPLADGRFTAMAIFIVQGVLAFTIGIISGSVKLSPERYTQDG